MAGSLLCHLSGLGVRQFFKSEIVRYNHSWVAEMPSRYCPLQTYEPLPALMSLQD